MRRIALALMIGVLERPLVCRQLFHQTAFWRQPAHIVTFDTFSPNVLLRTEFMPVCSPRYNCQTSHTTFKFRLNFVYESRFSIGWRTKIPTA